MQDSGDQQTKAVQRAASYNNAQPAQSKVVAPEANLTSSFDQAMQVMGQGDQTGQFGQQENEIPIQKSDASIEILNSLSPLKPNHQPLPANRKKLQEKISRVNREIMDAWRADLSKTTEDITNIVVKTAQATDKNIPALPKLKKIKKT
jgi:hypothetical protein